MTMVFYKYVNIFIATITLLNLAACRFNFFGKSELEKKIRSDFKEQLIPLPPVPYAETMGRVPKSEEIELGRSLFNDPIVSRNNEVSCSTCHLTNHGFTDGNSLSIGVLGQGGPTGDTVGRTFGKGVLNDRRAFGDDSFGFLAQNKMFRNTLSTVNVAYRMKRDNTDGLFHDGRFGSLFFQTLLPIHTSMEMCGENPVPIKNNPFEPGGIYFKTPVHLTHVNTFDGYEGRDLGQFNAAATEITGVPTFRPNGTLSVPGRNECLAIAIAKIRSVPEYQKKFKAIYDSEVTDQLVSTALTSFIITQVSKRTPYDEFVKGESTLTDEQLKGMAAFFTPLGKTYKYKEETINGAGCFKCHNAPLFGGTGFASLGVRSDRFSILSKPQNITTVKSAFFGRVHLQRGIDPGCHVEGVTVSDDGYAPDIGRANATFKNEDCFKMRVPQLRNVIETYPYFHHGTARGQGELSDDLETRALAALNQVVKYHLRGPIDPKTYSKNLDNPKIFYDDLHQKDYYIPYFNQNFIALDPTDPQHNDVINLFPANLSEVEIKNLIDFIAYGLYDRESVQVGDLGNDLSHPKEVLSGFKPSITRDNGNQTELPPNTK